MSALGSRSREGQSTATMLGIAARIRGLRFHLDRSQTQFAALVGAPLKKLEAWELGQGIERSDLALIADRTGASLHWLISGLSASRIEAIRAEAVRSLDQGHAARRDRAGGGGRRPAPDETERSQTWNSREDAR